MRTLVMVHLDTEKSNQTIRDGTIDQVLGRVLGEMKPEAAYFYAHGGKRAFTMVVDVPDPTYIPSFLEPFWLEMNAHVEMIPCMNAEELRTGLGRLG